MALLYGHTGRLTTKTGGFRPGQRWAVFRGAVGRRRAVPGRHADGVPSRELRLRPGLHPQDSGR